MNTETSTVEGVTASNEDFVGTTALQIRLETRDLINQIEHFLRGKEPNTFWDEKSQSWQTRLVDMGTAKANPRGIQGILNFCRAIINPQTVQGNYTKEEFLKFIAEKRIELARMCFVNFYEWELVYDNVIAEITEFVMNIVEPFMSRTIDNEERKSYAQTIRTNETNTVPKQSGMFGGLGQ